MHVNVFVIITARFIIPFSAKASKTFICQESCNLSFLNSWDNNIYSQVKLIAFDEIWVINIPLNYHILRGVGGDLSYILEDANVISLWPRLRLCNKCSFFILFLVRQETIFVSREHKSTGHKIKWLRIEIACNSHHFLKYILPCKRLDTRIPINDSVFIFAKYVVYIFVLRVMT